MMWRRKKRTEDGGRRGDICSLERPGSQCERGGG